MSTDEHARPRRDIDAHFAGRSKDERVMREHLASCEACTAYYERHLVLSELDPRALSRQARLGRSIGLGRTGWPRWTWGAATLVPAAAALLLFVHGGKPPSEGFTARGSAAQNELVVHRLRSGSPPETSPSQVAPSDELAFSYRNPLARRRLMVFGVDEHRHVYWYHPAYTDPSTDPAAIPIEGGAAPHELPEAIGQSLDGHALRVYGVFTDRALTVKEVEAAIARGGEPAFAGATTLVRTLAVTP